MDSTFKSLLYGSYIDLHSYSDDSPYHAIGLAWSVDDALGIKSPGYIQASTNASFREQLTSQSLAQYAVTSLGELPSRLASEKWKELTKQTANINKLNDEKLISTLIATSRVGFYEQTLQMISNLTGTNYSKHFWADVEYQRLWARFRLWLDGAMPDYNSTEFEILFENSPTTLAKLNSAYQVVMQNCKFTKDLNKIEQWQKKHWQTLVDLKDSLPEPAWDRYHSRYYRVGGFIPQFKGDASGTAEIMQRAVELAENSKRETPGDNIMAEEMLYACTESRMQEARWLKDFDLALQRLDTYIKMKPYDPKAWSHLGDVQIECEDYEKAANSFLNAALYAPPGREVALYRRGRCLERIAREEEALEAYVQCLDIDPLGIGPLSRIRELAPSVGKGRLGAWASDRLNHLGAAYVTTTS